MNETLRNFVKDTGRNLRVPSIALLAALAGGSVVVLISGGNPLVVATIIFESSFGSLGDFGNLLYYAAILTATGLGFAVAYRTGLFNIGLEGQLIAGAVAAAWLGYSLDFLPPIIHTFVALSGAVVAAALWAGIPGFFKARFGAHEVVVSVMLNYVAFEVSGFLVEGPLHDGSGTPQTPRVLNSASLGNLVPDSRASYGVLIVLALAIGMGWFLWNTRRGFEIRAVGINPTAARFAGINEERSTVLAMALSGACAGLGGGIMSLGYLGRFIHSWPGYGFEGIGVALLGQNHPVGIILAAILLGAFRASGFRLQLIAGVTRHIVMVLTALVVIFVGIGSRKTDGGR